MNCACLTTELVNVHVAQVGAPPDSCQGQEGEQPVEDTLGLAPSQGVEQSFPCRRHLGEETKVGSGAASYDPLPGEQHPTRG